MTRTRLVAILGTILLGVGLLAGCSESGNGGDPRTVTVVGNGKVTGVPDTLRATVGVESSGPDVSTALNTANGKVKTITDAVVKAGVERKDVQTQQVSLTPRYNTPAPGGTSVISGYQATNTLQLTMRDMAKASEVLAAAANAGGDDTRVSGVSFAVDDDSKLLEQARKAAFDDARTRAEQYASLAGDSLGKVVTIKETTGGEQPPAPADARNETLASPVPIEPGEQTVTFTVTVTYGLS
ncbi:SIMPL domain-containing protein [Gordonia sinesedis]